MEIRDAALEDLDGLARLWNEFMDFHEELDPAWQRIPEAEGIWRKYITGLIEDPKVLVLVAEDDGRLVGHLTAMIQELPPVFPEKCYGFVQEISVTAEKRGQGVAHLLYERAEAWSRQRGANHMRANIDTGNQLSRAFWNSVGFATFTETLTKRLDHDD